MASQFEHLNLPKTSIELPRRGRSPGGFGSRSDRTSHGRKLLEQALGLLQSPKPLASPFGINPKLIFKLKLSPNSSFPEKELLPMGLTLLAQEPKANKAIVVFSSDEELTLFRSRLEAYSGISDIEYEYGYLDAIEDLVPLEPQDRTGRLLELEPVRPEELAALDLELWHTGDKSQMREYLDNLDQFLRSFTDRSVMRVSDRYIGEYLCIARVKVTDEILSLLLEEELVKEISRRPKPTFESPADYNVPLSKLPEVVAPPKQNCGVLVIDFGVSRGQPLIAPALGEAEVFPDKNRTIIAGGPDDGDEKTGGHGTGVAAIAIYGDLNLCIKEHSFQPTAWLFSARVTDKNNEYDPDLLLENQLEQAIQYFTENYSNCKVINISLGDSRLPFADGQKQFRIAAKIDEIAFKLQHKNLVFVISAGNSYYDAVSNELFLRDYPNYLLSQNARIIEPATSAIALTVGSISLGTGSLYYSDDAQRNAVAKLLGYPSPFTRSGFGVDGMIKPDLVDFGGDFVIDKERVIHNEPGVSILTLAKDYSSSLFRMCCGTSFAAVRTANIVAQLFTQFPNATSNLIRALIANSAALPAEIPSALQGDEKQIQRLQIYGYGQPNLLQAKYSAENYVVLLVDNAEIPVGKFQIYEIPPLPDDFLETQGSRNLSITLAFDPPTRPTRGDSYLGVTMEFNLFKNIRPLA